MSSEDVLQQGNNQDIRTIYCPSSAILVSISKVGDTPDNWEYLEDNQNGSEWVRFVRQWNGCWSDSEA